jgi:hypothetical protein
MIHLAATEDCKQIYNVVRPARVSISPTALCAEYGLCTPNGRYMWTWMSETDARASSQYCNTPGTHVVRRSWVQMLCDLDESNADYTI